ncbi:MAG: T9SS type A sorting domain-containing protein [Bacteroidia bacterium]|nr:T9SS type A sorting domain-containing protein [Bacteroidia bacterium]
MKKIITTLCLISALAGFSQPTWNPEICMVTVDSATASYVSVIWNKPAVTDIDSFYVYREVTVSVFSKIAAVAYTDSSVYDDIAVNVNTTSYNYKISAIDLSGIEGQQSNASNSIKLNVAFKAGYDSCWWTSFQNFSNPATGLRCVWDSSGAMAAFAPIGSTFSPTWVTWNHMNQSAADSSHYRLEAYVTNSCDPSRAIINTSRSNVKNLASPTMFINDPQQANLLVRAFPNPSNGIFNLEWNGSMQIGKIEIVDVAGQIVQSFIPEKELLKKTVDLSSNAKGFYFVRFHSAKGIISKRIVSME